MLEINNHFVNVRCKFYLPAEDDTVSLKQLEQQIAVTQQCLRRKSFSLESGAACQVSDVTFDMGKLSVADSRRLSTGETDLQRLSAGYNECLAEGLDTSLSSLSQFSDVSDHSFSMPDDSPSLFRGQHCSTPDFRLLSENIVMPAYWWEKNKNGLDKTASSLSSSVNHLDSAVDDSDISVSFSQVPRSPTDAVSLFPCAPSLPKSKPLYKTVLKPEKEKSSEVN